MTLKQLEVLLMTHLQESGEIRSDLKWLKKAFWVLVGGVLSLVGILLKLVLARIV